uniref:Uncharacterized protein n=1 Tax=Aegilops tauschii subsp. strangulata TaxID=200361 RepID=A0A453CCS7_AEGTS
SSVSSVSPAVGPEGPRPPRVSDATFRSPAYRSSAPRHVELARCSPALAISHFSSIPTFPPPSPLVAGPDLTSRRHCRSRDFAGLESDTARRRRFQPPAPSSSANPWLSPASGGSGGLIRRPIR